MGALDLRLSPVLKDQMRQHFIGLHQPCPSRLCDGMLDDFEQISAEPFKAFLVCSKCESRLRIYRKER